MDVGLLIYLAVQWLNHCKKFFINFEHGPLTIGVWNGKQWNTVIRPEFFY